MFRAIPSVPSVGIVLVNYKGRDDTLECLTSLADLTYPRWFAVLVDNASADGTPEAVRRDFPDVAVIECEENLGFAGGNNVGTREALARGADFVFFLNNDTTVDPNLLGYLVSLFTMRPRVGIAGALMLYYDEPEVVWSAGGRIDGRGQSFQTGQGRPASEFTEVTAVDFVVGCGLMARAGLFSQVGLLDEMYFLYYEETDWCARVKEAGWEIVTEPRAKLWHKVSRTTGGDSPLTLYYMRRNQLLYLKKHGGKAGQAGALLDAVRLLGVWTLKRHPHRAALARAIADFRAGRFGKAENLV